MKRTLLPAALAFLTSLVTPATSALAADIDVIIPIGEPGYYGLIDIYGYSRPRVIYREPIAVEWVPIDRRPIYLRVPLKHRKHWRRYCHHYHACGERVYFVDDVWYHREYVPRYREYHRHHRREDRRDYRHDRREDRRREDRRDYRHDRREDRRHDRREDRREDRRHDRREDRREDRHGHRHGH